MIELRHITKYYNKKKINQLTVCKDISLTFEDTGLVMILGASGSGKTTLLNVISGMDKYDSGEVLFNGTSITRYNHKKWETIRQHDIGYVHQNYHLLKERTVRDNIKTVLQLQGIQDPIEQEPMILGLLETVGLGQYIDRLVKQLSGGQQQRVAFARALANNPSVILADEPTGNLDSKTTIELMNVIKSISQTRLVVMVTHEQILCDFYADRIIQIENGAIVSDTPNEKHHSVDYIQEHIINLKQFSHTELSGEKLKINRYTADQTTSDDLTVDLIERNQTLYVKVDSPRVTRTKYIDDESEIIIHSGNEDKNQVPQINVDAFVPSHKEDGLVFTWKEAFHNAIHRHNPLQKGYKLLYVVLFVVGFIVAIGVGLIGEVQHVEEPYSYVHHNYISVYLERQTFDDVMKLEDIDYVDQLIFVNKPYAFTIETQAYYEIRTSIKVDAIPVDIKFFDETTLLYGRLPNELEIVIDKSVADEIIRENQDRGISTYDDVLNSRFKLQTSGIDTNLAIDTALYYNISGIADDNSLSVWMKEELIYSFLAPNLIDYTILGDHFSIESGTLPTSERYIMLNENYPSVKQGDIPYNVGVAMGSYYISGIYSYTIDGKSYNFTNAFVTEMEYIKDDYYMLQYGHKSDFEVFVYARNVEAALDSLHEAGYSAYADLYQPTLAQEIKYEQNQTVYLIGLGGILMSAFSIFLITRSSLMSRIYEVSVYRAIGIRRREIRRMFLIEILLTTTFSSIIGYILAVLLLSSAQSRVDNVSITYFSFIGTSLGIVGLYVINSIFGLIPIHRLLHQTPADIIRKTDL